VNLELDALAGEPPLLAVNVSRGGVVLADRVEWAGTSERRRRGLLGRDRLGPGEAIYLVPCIWIHMFGMRFPIDVAFLAESGRVLAVHRRLRPNRLSRLVPRAEGILELPAGRLDETGTQPGDLVSFRQADSDARGTAS
jgi:uncharacterized membrane protein (UPF0127 family)